MTQDIGLRRTVMLAGVATLLIVALACTRTVEVPGETVVVEKEVVKTVEVQGARRDCHQRGREDGTSPG